MNYFTKDLSVIAREILAALRSIKDRLTSLREDLQAQNQAIHEATQAAERDTNKNPEVRAILNFPESVQTDKKTANEAQRSYQDRNLLLALLTLVALVIYAITTIFIYFSTDRAATATENAANAAAAAAGEAKTSRIQAEESLRTTIAQSQLDQRAWVGSKAMGLTNFSADKPITGTVAISNSGKTFAVNAIVRVWIDSTRTPVAQLPHKMLKEVSPMVIFPNQEISISVNTSIATKSSIDAIKEHKIILYLYGDIVYFDVFKKRHKTEFCGVFDGDKDFLACRFHNTAD